METNLLNRTLMNKGVYDNIAHFWFESVAMRSICMEESNSLKEFIAHPLKEECARNWAIATRIFESVETLVMQTMATEIEEAINNNPMLGIIAMLEAMKEMG